MAIKIIINIFLIISLATLQLAFLSGLPGWFEQFNLILVVLIFILGFAGFNLAAWWSVGAGLMMEIFSFSPFGVYLISLGLTVAIANFLLNYFFTNRSLYSFLALTALTTLAYELIINGLFLIFTDKGFFLISAGFWVLTFEQLFMNLLFTLLAYYLLHFLGRNLRPVFLIKRGQR